MKRNLVESKSNKKICLISSSGGHFEQLKMLSSLKGQFDIVTTTERTKYNLLDKDIDYFLPQVNRKELTAPFKMARIALASRRILKKERPDAIISTGALAAIPMIYIGKKMGIKTIYIESFAKVTSPTLTGSFIYKHHLADRFYVQWSSMLKVYPNAIYAGGIY